MDIKLVNHIEDGVEYEITDMNGNVYGIHDIIDKRGMIIDTIVVDMETLDEVEDSELFKKLVTLRSNYAATVI